MAAAIVIGGSANAATTIALDTGGVNTPGATTISGLNVGNTRTFTSGSVTLTAQGWTYDRSFTPDRLLSSNLGAWSGYGMGVASPRVDTNGSSSGYGNGGAQETGSGSQHTVDNNGDGRVDFILLKFSEVVDLNSIYLRVFDVNPNGGADSDATVYYADGAAAPVNGGDAESYLSQFTSIDLPGNGSSGTRLLDGVTYSDTWLIAAAHGSNYNDGFKVKSLSYDVRPPVPEPATWLFMIMGFGGAGAMLRRRREIGQIAA